MSNSKYHRVHLWIGSTKKTEEEFQEYFELDYSEDVSVSDPEYKVCGFCKDIGERWYDEDFFGALWFEKPLKVEDLLKNPGLSQKTEYEKAIEIAKNLGIEKANAIVWYQDDELTINKPYKDSYNDLKYIGEFYG